MNKRLLVTIVAAGGMVALAACSKHHGASNQTAVPPRASAMQPATPGMPTAPPSMATGTLPHLAYVARLTPLNGDVTRTPTTGRAQFGINNGMLTIRISVTGAPPGIAHAQHIHGFLSGKAASCPTKTADANGDGLLSLSEAEAVMGPPLIPLNGDLLAMNFTSLTYPTANADGTYTYQETVSLSALQSAYAKMHNGQKLDLAKDTVMIHGVPESAQPPSAATTATTTAATSAGTVAAAAGSAPESAERVPASLAAPAALPIACGKITPVR